ncbi:hypothetical protein BDQ17DRAFT_1327886 [Cyathus striatus]|nr:hypothetical protein BDQ17DRAFT_1327886 [Cyathus striatus]
MSDTESIASATISPSSPNWVKCHSSKDGKITHLVKIWSQFQAYLRLEDDSVRVDGNGEAVIQDVTISTLGLQTEAVKSAQLEVLIVEKQRKENAIKRTEKFTHYIEVTTEYQEDLIRQRKELNQIGQDISKECPLTDGKTATMGVFSESEEEIELSLHYAVTQAGWTPVYDVRVNTESKEKCIKLVYKASVTQRTGEEWKDAHLTLETSLPQFNVNMPTLAPWKLRFATTGIHYGQLFGSRPLTDQLRSERGHERIATASDLRALVHANPMDAHAIATFEVPEPKTILGNGTVHKVTVTELELDGELKWVSIPTTKDVRMHWTAMVHNDSEYPLLKGAASVYVNGSFTARSEIPHVNPQERFNCALGLYTRSNNHISEQRITLVNTKSCTVSNESFISVKLHSPALPVVDTSENKNDEMSKVVEVCKGVVAQWEKGDGDAEVDKLGLDGKISWNCSIPAQGKVTLLLAWEVLAPADRDVIGL